MKLIMTMASGLRRPQEDEGSTMRLVGLVCFIALGAPFLLGYGTLPMTNFAGEIISMVGFALLLVIATQYGALDAASGMLKSVWASFALMLLAIRANGSIDGTGAI